MHLFEHAVYDQERALYGVRDAHVRACRFEGPADGESALKECRHIRVEDCDFQLRYPFWHVEDAVISQCRMTETCRAALWYDKHVTIRECELHGIKALRECEDVTILGGHVRSSEFGWKCRGVRIDDLTLESEYPFLLTEDMESERLQLKGKYSFQYVKNAVIRNAVLDTKDAFWHSENVTILDSVIKGEYLAWYSKRLRLVRCRIIGTQPLCYCDELVLEDCTMEEADLAFENSNVQATVLGAIDSVKNPIHGFIRADSIGEVILDAHRASGADCRIEAGPCAR